MVPVSEKHEANFGKTATSLK